MTASTRFSPACTVCSEPISDARIKAQPNARQCVPCLEHAGDVPRIRQFSETTREGEVIAIHFRDNPYIEGALRDALAAESFDVDSGDDADLERPRKSLWYTVPMSDVVEEEV